MATDDDSLIDYLQSVVAAEGSERTVGRLIVELGDGDFQHRERVAQRLVELGERARAALQKNRDHPDAEVARRVRECLSKIGQRPQMNVPLIAVRLLVSRRVERAIPVFLDCLGQIADRDMEEEIYFGLDSLSQSMGKTHPALVAALHDKRAGPRAVAACLLGRVGDQTQKDSVRRLLGDREPAVRLRAAQGLLAARDSAGVEALIGLLEARDIETAWQAEELLHWIAGDATPNAAVGSGCREERERCTELWKKWWRVRKGSVDWAEIGRDGRRPGLVFLRDYVAERTAERYTLCGCDGLPRYSFEARTTFWAREGGAPGMWIGGGKLLGWRDRASRRLTERDLLGRAEWTSEPLEGLREAAWRRLGDGRTLLSDGKVIVELDPGGRMTKERPVEEFVAPASRGKSGEGEGRGQGGGNKNLKNYRLEPKGTWFGKEGRLFVRWVNTAVGKAFLVEYDPGSGEPRQWIEVSLRDDTPTEERGIGVVSAGLEVGERVKLRNGNTLIGHTRKEPEEEQAAEMDGEKRKVWESVTNSWVDDVEVVCPIVRLGFNRDGREKTNLDTVAWRTRQLRSMHAACRVRAARWLAKAPPTAAIARAFLYRAEEPEREVRAIAMSVLFQSRELEGEAICGIAAGLRDPSPEVRRQARGYLSRAGVRAIPLLLAIVRDPRETESARGDAVVALTGYLQRDDPEIATAVRRELKEGSVEKRGELLLSFRACPGAERFLGEALEALNDREPSIVRAAGLAIGGLGEKATTALPTLVKGLEKRRTRAAAAYAIQGIHPPASTILSTLVKHMDDEADAEGRIAIIRAIGAYRKEAASTVPQLVKALDGRHGSFGSRGEEVQLSIMMALREIGPEAKQALPRLRKLAVDPAATERSRAFANEVVRVIEGAP
jgi:HEAT repeat protein